MRSESFIVCRAGQCSMFFCVEYKYTYVGALYAFDFFVILWTSSSPTTTDILSVSYIENYEIMYIFVPIQLHVFN